MVTIGQVLAAVLGGNAIFQFIQYLIDRHDRQKVTPEQRAIRNLLARCLSVDLKDWLHADVRTAADWEIIDNNFQSYRELGGNGKIHKLYDEAREIPTTE